MSNSQIAAIDYKYLLLEYYKKLHLSEEELAILLVIDHLISQKNSLITPELLSMKMNADPKTIDKTLVSLIERGFIKIDIDKKVKTSLKPLQKKLYELFQKEIALEAEIKNNKELAESIDNVTKTFEKEYKRTLSPIERSIILDWIDHGYKGEQIIDAMLECLSKGKKTFREIDKLLFQWQTRDDIEKAGISGASNKWDQNIEKTMKIAKAKWIDD